MDKNKCHNILMVLQLKLGATCSVALHRNHPTCVTKDGGEYLTFLIP